MGRKSKAKEKARKVKAEKAKKKQAKVQKLKKLKPEIKMPPKKQLFPAALILIMITLVAAVGYLIFQSALKPEPIARFLPAEETVLTLEINSNLRHQQLNKTFHLLDGYEDYSLMTAKRFLERKFLVDFEGDVEPWLGRNIGLALLSSKQSPDQFHTMFFAETFSHSGTENFLENKTTPTPYLDHTIHLSPTGRAYTFFGNYLFFSDTEQAVRELIDSHQSGAPLLSSSQRFKKIDNEMPLHRVGFLYLNFKNMSEAFFESKLAEYPQAQPLLAPYLPLLDSEGLALIASDENFIVHNFVALDSSELKDAQYIATSSQNYSAELTKFVSPEATAFWGGQNLETELKRIMEVFANGNPTTFQVYERIIESYTNQYFGSEISLNRDLLPLFRGEFALAIESVNNQDHFKLLIESNNQAQNTETLHKVIENFSKIGTSTQQRTIDYTLPDGTPAKEIVAVPQEVSRTDIPYQKDTIYKVRNLYYTVLANVAVVSTNLDLIKQTIDMSESNDQHVAVNKIKNSDEVTYLNVQKILPIIFPGGEIPDFIRPIKSVSSSKTYLRNGITTINYLEL